MNDMNAMQAAALMTFSHLPAMLASERGIEGKGTLVGMEVMNVLGYIPLVGCIVAIARMIFAANESRRIQNEEGEEAASAFKTMFSLRAAAEFLCLGPLLAISDLIVTLWLKNKINQAENHLRAHRDMVIDSGSRAESWLLPEIEPLYDPNDNQWRKGPPAYRDSF